MKFNISKMLKSAGKFTKDNASTACMVGAIMGLAASVYFAVKESDRAKERLYEEPDLNLPEKIGIVVGSCPKTAASVLVTGSCIVAGHIIDHNTIAGLSLLASTQAKKLRIKDKAIEKVLPEEEVKKIDQEFVREYLFCPDETTAIRTGHGDILCYEPYTGHFFYSCQNYIQKVENDLNRSALECEDDYIMMDDFFRELGLPVNTKFGDAFGFSCSEGGLDLYFDSGKTPEGIPYLIIKHRNEPIEI